VIGKPDLEPARCRRPSWSGGTSADRGPPARLGARSSRRYKTLHEVEFVDSIPKTASGKILRRVLREQERKRLTSSALAGPAFDRFFFFPLSLLSRVLISRFTRAINESSLACLLRSRARARLFEPSSLIPSPSSPAGSVHCSGRRNAELSRMLAGGQEAIALRGAAESEAMGHPLASRREALGEVRSVPRRGRTGARPAFKKFS